MFVAIYVMNSCDATVINLPTKQWTAIVLRVHCYRAKRLAIIRVKVLSESLSEC